MPNPATVGDVAVGYFGEGYNCAQSVLRAVAEAHDLACPACIPAVALALGGGIGHTGNMCGAVVGGVMAIGLAVDRTGPREIIPRKRAAAAVGGRLVTAFQGQFNYLDCRGILGFDWSEPDAGERFQRENAAKLKCAPCVRWAAEEASRLVAEALL
jgi:C_GCAxxG_C_C family probable redox protein